MSEYYYAQEEEIKFLFFSSYLAEADLSNIKFKKEWHSI